MHCLKCGYDLRDLTDPSCPECGHGFDPGNLKSWGGKHAVRYGKLARLAGWICALIAAIPLVLGGGLIPVGRNDFAILILLWIAATIPFSLATAAYVGCRAGYGRLPSSRAVIVGVMLFLLNASLLAEWPMDVAFMLHRPALNHYAQQATSTSTLGTSKRIGIYTVDNKRVSYPKLYPNAVVFQISRNTNGPDYLVHGMTDQQVETYFNIWSYRRLDQDWHLVHED